jgi:hypothetical protein
MATSLYFQIYLKMVLLKNGEGEGMKQAMEKT